MRRSRLAGRIAGFGVIVCAVLQVGIATPAEAGYRDSSCGDLWYARNAIYARNGYCFKSPRGIATFGPGCYAPYGRLSGYEQRQVSKIKTWEARKGCSDY